MIIKNNMLAICLGKSLMKLKLVANRAPGGKQGPIKWSGVFKNLRNFM
jgi:hypothetical protein